MKYQNPIIRGFYPDPSVCAANGKYYLVCSSMHYFPGVPLFESDDLIHWNQIGHCLSRPSQIALEQVNSSGGVFAPTIRYYNGRFYMTTTNATTQQNFYVWTEDIYGEWSEPIFVDQGGIDPSLYFEEGHTYFMSNGVDEEGIGGIVQCEIDILTGEKISKSVSIWQGSGGRYLEGPHLYKFCNQYYLLAAEGGTEYGHMVTYARSASPFGPFEGYPHNPVLTNRNLGGNTIQGVGHGDIVEAPDGSFWLLHLGFRQTGQWTTFHHLGREVFITPITWQEDGWFTAGTDGTTTELVDVSHTSVPQRLVKVNTFQTTSWTLDWCYLRHPNPESYLLSEDKATLFGTEISLNEVGSPTFVGVRQKEFEAEISCRVRIDKGEAGITLMMDEHHHYDLAMVQEKGCFKVIQRLCVGTMKVIQNSMELGENNEVVLRIHASNQEYQFFVETETGLVDLGSAWTRYLSSEMAGGFTGVMIGLYAYDPEGRNKAEFTEFCCTYN